jgi:Tfp pilus assembly protein PilX
MTTAIRRRAVKDTLATQSGFALTAALAVLFIVVMLAAAAVAVSVRSSTSTTRDDNVKAALEAAETGLRVATYRLAMIALKPEQCVGTATSGAPEAPVGGYCKDATETLGNQASFTYWTTPVLTEPATCAGDPIKAEAGTDQRCVTGEGKVNGVTRRVQGRVAAPSAKPLFAIHGIVGLTKLSLSGGSSLQGLAGSNGKLETSGGGIKLAGGYTLGFPGGTFKGSAGEVVCPPCGMRSKEEGPIPGALPPKHITAATSEDSRITAKEDELTGAVTWNAANYELLLGSSGHVVLGGSKYYFCKVNVSGGGVLTVTATGNTEIFIDSFEDPGSPCKNYGKEAKVFEFSGGSKLQNSSNDPSKLLIEMYGKTQLIVSGAGEVAASVLAPEAKAVLSGGSALKGGMLANVIEISGGSFAWDERSAALKLENSGAEDYARVPAWEECVPTGATPQAGC